MMGLGGFVILIVEETCKNTIANNSQLDHNHLKQLETFSRGTYQNPNTQAMVTKLYKMCDDLTSNQKLKIEIVQSKCIVPTRCFGEQ